MDYDQDFTENTDDSPQNSIPGEEDAIQVQDDTPPRPPVQNLGNTKERPAARPPRLSDAEKTRLYQDEDNELQLPGTNIMGTKQTIDRTCVT